MTTSLAPHYSRRTGAHTHSSFTPFLGLLLLQVTEITVEGTEGEKVPQPLSLRSKTRPVFLFITFYGVFNKTLEVLHETFFLFIVHLNVEKEKLLT